MPSSHRLVNFMLFALLVLVIAASQIHHFDRLNFRQDELISAYAGVSISLRDTVIWMSRDVHPPLWHVLGAGWVMLFGMDEGIDRFLSVLTTALTLAVLYRFCADLFGQRVGVIAVALLGTLALFHFYSHEFRPYALLTGLTITVQWLLLRWLRRPGFFYGFWFVVAGIVLLYSHYFGLYVLAALALVFALLVKWERGVYLRAFGLFAAVGLAFVGWLLPFIYITLSYSQQGGLNYGITLDALGRVGAALQVRPVELSLYLLASGLLLPGALASSGHRRFRWGRAWRQVYVGGFFVAAAALIFASNQSFTLITLRNMLVLAPPAVMLLAVGVACQPPRLQPLLVLIAMLPVLVNFRNLESQMPYREVAGAVAPYYQPGMPILLSTGLGHYQHTMTSFNLLARVPGLQNDDLVQLQNAGDENMPHRRVGTIIREIDAVSIGRMWDAVGESERLWFVSGLKPDAERTVYRDEIERYYAPLRFDQWENFSTFSASVTEYRRIPPDLRPQFIFGETFLLLRWNLRDSVEVAPCQTITLESWWTQQTHTEFDFSLTLTLADASGVGIARADAQPGYLETSDWTPGLRYPDERTLTIPCDAPPGEYPLLMGIYYPYSDNPEALPVFTAEGAPLPSSLIYLTTLFIG